MFSRSPFISRLVLFVFVPLMIISGFVWKWFSGSLPVEQGKLTYAALAGPAKIQYDSNGIPNISSNNDMDTFFALGFVHAQNRLWQMEMNRRIASGTLSEVLGARALRSDVFMRTVGLQRNAQRMWNELGEREKSVLSVYVEGVNEGIAALGNLPPEFHLLQYKPGKWTEVDSLLWMQLMTFIMSSNMSEEIMRSQAIQAFDLEKASELMTGISEIEETQLVQTELASIADLLQNIPAQYQVPELFVGSNSWVLSGEYTASGKAMLANDPHLSNSIPSVFYLARLKGETLNASGATFPGLPFVVIGKNDKIAWGMTTMMADTQDIYLERINPHNQNQYEVNGEYRDMQVFKEKINIKAELLKPAVPPLTIDVKATHHGPLLSDIVGKHNHYAYSLRWTGDDQDGRTFSSLLNLNYAQNWQQFEDALKDYVAPIHNFVYADIDGNIGYLAPGAFPLRPQGHGLIPTIGWQSENDWSGWIGAEQWPRTYNPDSGYIVTANNDMIGDDYPFYVSEDWAPGYRATQIEYLLKELIATKSEGLTVDDFKAIQLNTRHPFKSDYQPSSLVSAMFELADDNAEHLAVVERLKQWNGDMDSDNAEPAVFAAWLAHFNRLLVEDDVRATEFADSSLNSLPVTQNLAFIEKVLADKQSDWCDYSKSEKVESCEQLLSIALEHALHELSKELGSDFDDWRWSDLHIAHYPHFPFSEGKYLPNISALSDYAWSALFHREIGATGGDDTVNVAPASYAESTRFAQLYGASYRQIIDWGNAQDNVFSIPTGQSGNVMSVHYDDLMESHQLGVFQPLEASNIQSTLELIPTKSTNMDKVED